MGELWNAGELCTRVSRKDSVARQRAASGVGAPPGQGGVQCPVLGHSSLDKTIWLLLTLSSALTVAALLLPNALASLCLRNLAHLGHPSPKPTSPWNLLPPSLHSPMRAASGHTPTPLPGIEVARQPRASPKQAMRQARKTRARHHPWVPLEISTWYPPDKRWRQRSRQLSTKLALYPLGPNLLLRRS